MQNQTRQTTAAAASGRSSLARLPSTLREAVDAAIADGATIDEITARIRAGGGTCSRSAVGRYAKDMRDLIRRQQEADRACEMWTRALGERGQGHAGLLLIESLRTLVLSTLADLGKRKEPVPTEELARLALILRRIEGADKLRFERERAAAKAAAKAAPGPDQPRRKKGGLSAEAVAIIREAVEGKPPERAVTSAPVDPWNPTESHLIPLNPGESRPENESRVSRSGSRIHFPLSRLRPSGPEKEEGADTAFVPPPPFRREGDRGSWPGLRGGPASDGYKREEARAGYRRYGPPGGSRRGPSLTQRTVEGATACSADVAVSIHYWIKRIVSYLPPKRASRPQMAVSAGIWPAEAGT